MTPYFDDFETKLHAAARAQIAVGRPARRHRLASALPALASAAVAVLIAIVAVTALSHRHATGRPAASADLRASRAQLIDTLTIMRRPQSSADRRARPPFPFQPLPRSIRDRPQALEQVARLRAQLGDPVLDRPLIRALTAPDGDRISFFPVSFRPSRHSSARVEGLIVQLKTPHNGEIVNTLPTTTSIEDFRAHGLAMFLDDDRGALIVPDGVRSITVDSIGRVLRPGLPVRIRIVQTRTAPRTFAVHDNVATVRIGRLTATAARRKLPSGEVLSGVVIASLSVNVTWRGENGVTLRRTTTEFRSVYIDVHHR